MPDEETTPDEQKVPNDVEAHMKADETLSDDAEERMRTSARFARPEGENEEVEGPSVRA